MSHSVPTDMRSRYGIPQNACASWYGECISGSSRKFWSVYCAPVPAPNGDHPWSVTYRWGRIGTDGQTLVYRFRYRNAAEAELNRRAIEKAGRGYRVPWQEPIRGVVVPETVSWYDYRRPWDDSARGLMSPSVRDLTDLAWQLARSHKADPTPAVEPLKTRRFFEADDE
jgi:predicted DNA-binding WGR domain protein